jgi:DNA-binding NtrC family response regulator
MPNARILVIDDDSNVLDLTRFHLHKVGFDVLTAESGEDGLRLLAGSPVDVALTDLRLPDIDGIELVKRCKEVSPDTEIIVITGYSSIGNAVEAAHAGAFHFVEKPINYEELLLLINKAIESSAQKTEIKHLRGRLSGRISYDNLIGGSQAMREIYEIIDSVAASDANVLIVGESGTGKELVANAIHYKSHRAKKPFVKINCAALPKELIESELFGHTKGSFTGAMRDKVGLIGHADGGSLLMDEIGEMPMELQPKLLRMLEERTYTPVGSEKPQAADFRLICATNRNPLDAVREGVLREDLYYRVNTIEIQIPPLRERKDDIPRLAEYFLRVFAEKYGRPLQTISQAAYELLLAQSWPGNVRELQNMLERAVLMCKDDVIDAETLLLTNIVPTTTHAPGSQPETKPEHADPASGAKDVSTKERQDYGLSFEELCRLLVNQITVPNAEHGQHSIFEKLEGGIVQAALERTRGNKQAAANLLGLYRPRLYSIIKKHHLAETSSAE